MANTLRLTSITGQVFDRLVKMLAAAGAEKVAPAQFPDGTIRGTAGHDTGMGEIKIEYVYAPTESVLVLDVEKPFMFPWDGNEGVKANVMKIVDQAKEAVLFGHPMPVPPVQQTV